MVIFHSYVSLPEGKRFKRDWDGQLSGWWIGSHDLIFFHFIYGMPSFPLTFIFFRGVESTDQLSFVQSQMFFLFIY